MRFGCPLALSRMEHSFRRSASSISATDGFPTFVVCNRPLFDWNSRPRLASEQALRPVPLRRNCGLQSVVPSIDLLAKTFSFETQARAIQDISRSRVREFTLFSNTSKRNTSEFCEFPVQN